MTDAEYRQSYDVNVDCSEVISKVAANTYFIYQRSKKVGVWPIEVAARDFVMTNHTTRVSADQLD